MRVRICFALALAALWSPSVLADEGTRLAGRAAHSPPSLAEVLGVETGRDSGRFFLKIKLSGSRQFVGKALPADPSEGTPPRFYLDITGAHVAKDFPAQEFPNDPVRRVRFGQFSVDTARVVLELDPGVSPGEVRAQASEEGVTIMAAAAPPEVPTPLVTPESTPSPVQAALPVEEKKAEHRKPRIVIDAGHGGDDTGARGKRGTLEKDVSLVIARKMEVLFKKQEKYDVFMTRSDDRALSLADRTRMANGWHGDLFVSVHANASPRAGAVGVSTYFLDNADDKESLRVAMRENGELDPEASLHGPVPENYYLEVMKASMEKNFHTVQSTDLARDVQTALAKEIARQYRDTQDLGVRSARFYVLTGAEMPAILVETSFISNPKEEKRLKDPRYQDALARAVVQGIEKFFSSSVGKGDHSALYQP